MSTKALAERKGPDRTLGDTTGTRCSKVSVAASQVLESAEPHLRYLKDSEGHVKVEFQGFNKSYKLCIKTIFMAPVGASRIEAAVAVAANL